MSEYLEKLIKRVVSFEVQILVFHETLMPGLHRHTRSFTTEDEAQAYIKQVATAIEYSSDNPASRELAIYYVGQWERAYIYGISNTSGDIVI